MAEEACGERILVVDDDFDVRELCTRVLCNAGYAAFAVPDAEQARAYLDVEALDLLVVDIHLPHEDGISLLRHAQAVHPDLPAVLITGQAETSTVLDAIRLNVREYLCKPFTLRQLCDAVARTMEQRRDP